MTKLSLVMLPLFLCLLIGSASAIEYTISGVVQDEDAVGIYHAHVTGSVVGDTYTNETGYYEIAGAENGEHNITATKAGYYSNYTIETVTDANVTDADIVLTKKPIFADVIEILGSIVDIFPPIVLIVIAVVPVLILLAIVSFVMGLFGSILEGIIGALGRFGK